MTSMPVWVERPELRDEVRRKLEGNENGARNHGVDPQLHISENLGHLDTGGTLREPTPPHGGRW